jgi:hypothetical protein
VGEGGYGSAVLAKNPKAREQIALKSFKRPPDGKDISTSFFRELHVLVQLAQPCVMSRFVCL